MDCFIREIKITSVIHKAQDNVLASSVFAHEAVYMRVFRLEYYAVYYGVGKINGSLQFI
jgi:5-carboxymethyl-2-hydroxymuconate isomerase